VAAQLLDKSGHPIAAQWARDTACEDLRNLVDSWLERERPECYPVVGSSVGALQLCGSLYLMKRVRERGHSGQRVLGGSGLVGSVAQAVLLRCPDVDAIVDGEGEQALLGLTQKVLNGSNDFSTLPGVLSRNASDEIVMGCGSIPLDLSSAPAADLDEFCQTAAQLGVPKTALTLSFEYSRGCQWEHRTPGKLRGCTFCGLYRNSPNHRRKPVNRILRDVENAVQRFQVLNLAFVDAYLPPDYRDDLLDGLVRLPADVSFFSEMRCDFSKATVERLALRADRVQLGVESFSSSILNRIGKGVGAAKSVYSVRICQEYGISTQYNLMTHIPGVPRCEIDELCAVLPTLFGLVPPKLAQFYLDRNSLVFADPEAHGIAPESLDARRPPWLASSLGDGRISQVVSFLAEDAEADDAWSRVRQQVTKWQERWQVAQSARLASPLVWRNGGRWASVIDAREGVARIYLLEHILYDVFLACNEVTTQNKIIQLLPEYSPDMIAEALLKLKAHRLVFEDGSQVVSVAVRAGAKITPSHASRSSLLA